jgi:hypothetical protein
LVLRARSDRIEHYSWQLATGSRQQIFIGIKSFELSAASCPLPAKEP